MLGMKNYSKDYIDECRARVDRDLRAFKTVVSVARAALSANIRETPNPWKFSVEGERDSMMSMMTGGLPLAAQTEVVAKARRRRFTAAEKLRVLREADG